MAPDPTMSCYRFYWVGVVLYMCVYMHTYVYTLYDTTFPCTYVYILTLNIYDIGDDTNNDQSRIAHSRTATNYESTQQSFMGIHSNTNASTNENDASNNQRVYQSKKSSLRVRL